MMREKFASRYFQRKAMTIIDVPWTAAVKLAIVTGGFLLVYLVAENNCMLLASHVTAEAFFVVHHQIKRNYRPSLSHSFVSLIKRSATNLDDTVNDDNDDQDVMNLYYAMKNDKRRRYLRLDSVERVYCISDLHSDHAENLYWLCEKCFGSGSDDVLRENDLLVIAGDISHDIPTFRDTLRIIQSLSCQIMFVPGNHEAWLSTLPPPHRRRQRSSTNGSVSATPRGNGDSDDVEDSLEKLDQIYSICSEMNILTETVLVGSSTAHPIWLVPLQSWYDGSLSLEGCEDLCRDFGRWPWVDFQRCRWPEQFLLGPPNSENPRIPMGLTEHFLQRNQGSLDYVTKHINHHDGRSTIIPSVMTISHFLPNQQCLPDWKDISSLNFLRDEWLDHGAPEISAKFAKVAGTALLGQQIQSALFRFGSTESTRPSRHIHIFGHSHRPKDFEYQGTRYIHNPLGKPRERQLHMVDPNVNFQLIWDTRSGEVPAKVNVIRYWEEQGGGKEALRRRMTQPFSRGPVVSSSTVLKEVELLMRYNSSCNGGASSTSPGFDRFDNSTSYTATSAMSASSRVVVTVADNKTILEASDGV